VLEGEIEKDAPLAPARADPDRKGDARDDLEGGRDVVCPADPGDDEETVGAAARGANSLTPARIVVFRPELVPLKTGLAVQTRLCPAL
jgi:hypothetical protein